MSVNNKARRAAKRSKQRKQPTNPASQWRLHGSADEEDVADRLVTAAFIQVRSNPDSATEWAQRLARAVRHRLLAATIHRWLRDLTAAAIRHGWTPTDLGEITRRQLSAPHIPLVAALVAAETDRHPGATVSPAWRASLDALGPAQHADLSDVAGLADALEVAGLLNTLPRLAESLPPPGRSHRSPDLLGAPSGVLGKVRALLAKAESTEFPEEAEALSAKAQELIVTYALDRAAMNLDTAAAEQPVCVRRLWIDAPYVLAKAMLVDAVADANHCRSVVSEALGFVTVIGQPADVEACDLLVTSLLVQAGRAMAWHGRQGDGRGRSRTTSFRRSFLVAYATRIGERLRKAADDTLTASVRAGELVPVLARADERVRTATEQLFPELVQREVRISNALGWAAGQAAADLALLDTRGQITEQAS